MRFRVSRCLERTCYEVSSTHALIINQLVFHTTIPFLIWLQIWERYLVYSIRQLICTKHTKLFQRQASNLRLRHTSRRYLFLINHYYPPLLNILSWQHIVKQLKIVSGIVFRVSKTLTVLSPFWLGEILMMLHS